MKGTTPYGQRQGEGENPIFGQLSLPHFALGHGHDAIEELLGLGGGEKRTHSRNFSPSYIFPQKSQCQVYSTAPCTLTVFFSHRYDFIPTRYNFYTLTFFPFRFPIPRDSR